MNYYIEQLRQYINRLLITIKRFRFGRKMQLIFLEDLSLLVKDGIPVNQAIEMIILSSTGLTRAVAISLGQSIAEGQPLAEGMRLWFAASVVEIIRVGEAGGALAETMQSAINMLSQKGVAMGAFITALSYPLVVILMGAAVVVYMNNGVLPQFAMIKPESQWPEAGQRLVNLGVFIQQWWWAVILAVFVILLAFRWIMVNYVGELRNQLDRFPPFNFYRRLVAAQLLETLGLLVGSGLVFRSAIRVMGYRARPYLAYHLRSMENLLGMGKTNIAEVLDTGLIKKTDLLRLKIMSEVKGFEHGLVRMGVRGAQDTIGLLKLISRIGGGVLLVIGALIIVIIVQGLYLTGMSLAT